jgi:hypothetical protein
MFGLDFGKVESVILEFGCCFDNRSESNKSDLALGNSCTAFKYLSTFK